MLLFDWNDRSRVVRTALDKSDVTRMHTLEWVLSVLSAGDGLCIQAPQSVSTDGHD